MEITSPAGRNLKAPASWPFPIICGHYSMWRKRLHVSSQHNRLYYILFFGIFQEVPSPIASVGRSCARFAWKREKVTPLTPTGYLSMFFAISRWSRPRLSLWIIYPREQNARASDVPHPHIAHSAPWGSSWGVPLASFTGEFIHHYSGNMEAFTPCFSK